MNDYTELINNSKYYLDKNLRIISNLANLTAYLFQFIDKLNWVGFYLCEDSELYLGPFQGKPACTNISMGKGVCGTSASTRKILVVDDVSKFDGHITCDSDSKSEIVIPIISKDGNLFGVLDIDSPIKNRFDNELKNALETITNLLVDLL
ncbi:MAG: GAF domain-containing protein [Tenericutes bacterium]|nr:GAF domain-containing protein [Mycoplasmatota bacterium]